MAAEWGSGSKYVVVHLPTEAKKEEISRRTITNVPKVEIPIRGFYCGLLRPRFKGHGTIKRARPEERDPENGRIRS